MKIETKKQSLFTSEILEVLGGGECANVFAKVAQKWADELVRETFESLYKARKYYKADTVQFAVSVSLGEPEKDKEE